MTPEQKRIVALEETLLELVSALEDARMGFGLRYITQIRTRIKQNREAYRFTKPKAPQPTPPAASEEGGTPA